MTDRDTFAAAALTGLLAGPGGKTAEQWALHAYSLADAMLRERERNGAVSGCETVQPDKPTGVSSAWAAAANQQQRERGHYGSSFPYVQGPRSTNHDAVPEAKATNDGGTPKDADGTGNTGESLSESLPDYCWDGDTDGGDEMRIDDECRDPDLLAAEVRRLKTVIAAGEPTLTAEEREAIELAAAELDGEYHGPNCTNERTASATLRSLLARLA